MYIFAICFAAIFTYFDIIGYIYDPLFVSEYDVGNTFDFFVNENFQPYISIPIELKITNPNWFPISFNNLELKCYSANEPFLFVKINSTKISSNSDFVFNTNLQIKINQPTFNVASVIIYNCLASKFEVTLPCRLLFNYFPISNEISNDVILNSEMCSTIKTIKNSLSYFKNIYDWL